MSLNLTSGSILTPNNTEKTAIFRDFRVILWLVSQFKILNYPIRLLKLFYKVKVNPSINAPGNRVLPVDLTS